MLVASPLRSLNDETEPQKQEKEEEAKIADFSPGNWLDTIDFDDLLAGISNDKLKDFQIDLQKFSDETMEVKGRSPGMRNATMAEETTSASQETVTKSSPCRKEARKSRKTTTSGKKKVKVDWTPDLHRRFVQAVEQLGIDKAVPSRILELMGIDCLTRHNVASHLQKYRSQRKHLLAREAEAASWNQRRRMYAAAAAGPAPVNKESGVNNPWITPTIGIPTMPNFRPLNHLNVWGHPSVDHSYMAMWPKPFWLPHHHVMSPCYPPAVMPVPGIPPVPMTGLGVPSMHQGPGFPQPASDLHPSKESVDAAIGEVLSKPWMPLPLGLRPPSIDSVLGELQAQGISKIPPGG